MREVEEQRAEDPSLLNELEGGAQGGAGCKARCADAAAAPNVYLLYISAAVHSTADQGHLATA